MRSRRYRRGYRNSAEAGVKNPRARYRDHPQAEVASTGRRRSYDLPGRRFMMMHLAPYEVPSGVTDAALAQCGRRACCQQGPWQRHAASP
jgi:hypothetical protein